MIPTLLGIMVLNFAIIQFAPGGPVEQTIAKIKGHDASFTDRFTSAGSDEVSSPSSVQGANFTSAENAKYRGAQGLDPEIIKELEEMYGFNKPALTRFFDMVKSYAMLDFGDSFFRDESVVDLVVDKMPVSISLGLWTTLLIYLISIPLGIRKAVKDGSAFDVWSSAIIIVGYSIPSFLFGILLIIDRKSVV